MVRQLSILVNAILIMLSQPLMADDSDKWRTLDNSNLVLVTLPHGQAVIELAPQFSPKHVASFKSSVQQGIYDGNTFYRVIDGFVAQTGPSEAEDETKQVAPLKLEGEWEIDQQWQMTLVQSPDLFAEQTGFKDGFALASNPSENKAWLAHCPGVVAMARGNLADSATNHFYITNGQAPRYLDRIMTIFGRVVYGMEHVQAIQRTQVVEGDDAIAESQFTSLIKMQLMSSLPAEKQWSLAVENTQSDAFKEKLAQRKNRQHAFFFKKPPSVLDVCQVPLETKVIKRQ
jgi:cyclophilin family peptidyl-prolyl cis-trans isomerase